MIVAGSFQASFCGGVDPVVRCLDAVSSIDTDLCLKQTPSLGLQVCIVGHGEIER